MPPVEPAVLSLMRTAATGSAALDTASITEHELEWVVASGLGPLLRYFALDHLEHLPVGFDERLLRAELQAKINSKLRYRAMAEIIDLCGDRLTNGITLLKGISICEQHYPARHLRPMADIDFLVAREDVPMVEGALADLGYQQRSNQPASFYESHHHTMPFVHPHTRVRFEVHTRLLPLTWELAQAEVFSLQSVRRQSKPSTFAERRALRLSNELQLLLTVSDISWERWILGRPIPLFDALFLLQGAGSDFDWECIVAWMDHPGLSARLTLLLTYLERQQLISLPPIVSAALNQGVRRIGYLPLRILHGDLERHSMQGLPLKDWIGLHNRQIVWETLTSPRSSWLKLPLVPWNLAFPPGRPDRFNLRSALRRLQTAMSGDSRRRNRQADRK